MHYLEHPRLHQAIIVDSYAHAQERAEQCKVEQNLCLDVKDLIKVSWRRSLAIRHVSFSFTCTIEPSSKKKTLIA